MSAPAWIVSALGFAWLLCHPRRAIDIVIDRVREEERARIQALAEELARRVRIVPRESAPPVAVEVPAHGEPVATDPDPDLVHWSPRNTTACGLDWVNVTRWTIEAAYLVTCPGCLAALKSCGHTVTSAGELEYAPPAVKIVPAPEVGRWGRVPGRPLQPAPGVLASEWTHYFAFVRCGIKGGSATFDPARVTCPECRAKMGGGRG